MLSPCSCPCRAPTAAGSEPPKISPSPWQGAGSGVRSGLPPGPAAGGWRKHSLAARHHSCWWKLHGTAHVGQSPVLSNAGQVARFATPNPSQETQVSQVFLLPSSALQSHLTAEQRMCACFPGRLPSSVLAAWSTQTKCCKGAKSNSARLSLV